MMMQDAKMPSLKDKIVGEEVSHEKKVRGSGRASETNKASKKKDGTKK